MKNSDVANKIFNYLLDESSMKATASTKTNSDSQTVKQDLKDMGIPENDTDLEDLIKNNPNKFLEYLNFLEEQVQTEINTKTTDFTVSTELTEEQLKAKHSEANLNKTSLQNLHKALKSLNRYITEYNKVNESLFKPIKLESLDAAIEKQIAGTIDGTKDNLPEFSHSKTKLNKENIQRDPYYDGAFIAEYDPDNNPKFQGINPDASKSKILNSKTKKSIQKDWSPQYRESSTKVSFNDDAVLKAQEGRLAYTSNYHKQAKIKTPDEEVAPVVYQFSSPPKHSAATTSVKPSASSSLVPSDTIDRVTLLEEALMYNSQDKFVSLAKPIPLKKLIAQVKMADDKRVSDLKEMLKEALEDPEYAVSHENLKIISDQINSLSITKDKERSPSSHNIQNNLGSKDFVKSPTSSAEAKEDSLPNANTLRMSLKRLEEIDPNALKSLKEKDPTDLEHPSSTSVVIDGKNSFPFFTVEDQNNYNSLLKTLSDTMERNKGTGDYLSYDKVQKMIKKKGISPRVVIEVTNKLLRDRSDDETINTLGNLRKDAKRSLLTPVNLGVTSSPTEAFKTGQTYRKASSPER